ncbi:F0F1 ATP synthase subunit delta [Candidatus Saccharibacteria bacterium]|nr:F0F1 ATP synthase subunit delta [Candidatus Saccharibacteria bacterium]
MASETPQSAFVLPPAVYSPELLDSVSYEIEQYLSWYRENRIHTTVGATAITEPDHSTETAQVIQSWTTGQPLTLSSLQSLLKYLRELKLPVAHVTLAALPNHTQRQQLVDWFRGIAGPHVLISFVGDRNLGGGVLVRTPSRVFDYSWKQKLIEGRSKLAEVVHRV